MSLLSPWYRLGFTEGFCYFPYVTAKISPRPCLNPGMFDSNTPTLSQESAHFLCKGPDSIFAFEDHVISVTTAQSSCSVKEAIDNTQATRQDSVPIRLYQTSGRRGLAEGPQLASPSISPHSIHSLLGKRSNCRTAELRKSLKYVFCARRFPFK